MIVYAITALAGGLGAAARFALDAALTRRLAEGWLRLMIINISGSALLGLLAGLAAHRLLTPDAQTVLGAGFLGGYTTFSAASLATVRLVEEHRWPPSLASSLGMLLGSVAGAAFGLVAGLAL
jgi:fluoride exporter